MTTTNKKQVIKTQMKTVKKIIKINQFNLLRKFTQIVTSEQISKQQNHFAKLIYPEIHKPKDHLQGGMALSQGGETTICRDILVPYKITKL